MTDPQTPATEAGRTLVAAYADPRTTNSIVRATVLQCEAEARADALREASNSVADLEQRALGGVLWVRYQRVLAILDPETTP